MTVKTPVVGCVGTSIANGTASTVGESHWMKACQAASVPFVGMAMGAENMVILTSTGGHEMRYALLGACTDILFEHGVNDLVRGTVSNQLATVMARARVGHQQIAALGVRVWALTVPPSYNDSTDGWLTTGNQTQNPGQVNYAGYNDWIRAGCPENTSGVPQPAGTAGTVHSPYITGYFDVADGLETSRNSGIWKADGTTAGKYTADGVHPSELGHTMAALQIDLNKIRVAAGAPIPIRNLVKVGGVPALIH